MHPFKVSVKTSFVNTEDINSKQDLEEDFEKEDLKG